MIASSILPIFWCDFSDRPATATDRARNSWSWSRNIRMVT